MSFKPNILSESATGHKPFQNLAGIGKHDPQTVDQVLNNELVAAGIEAHRMPEGFRMRHGGEVYTVVVGCLYGWTFKRAWYYWIASGPGIPIQYAMDLHQHYGLSVRVGGMTGGYSPLEWAKGFPVTLYHIDNPEGLTAFSEVIRRIKAAGDLLTQAAIDKAVGPV